MGKDIPHVQKFVTKRYEREGMEDTTEGDSRKSKRRLRPDRRLATFDCLGPRDRWLVSGHPVGNH
jgi:hypothetical protein